MRDHAIPPESIFIYSVLGSRVFPIHRGQVNARAGNASSLRPGWPLPRLDCEIFRDGGTRACAPPTALSFEFAFRSRTSRLNDILKYAVRRSSREHGLLNIKFKQSLPAAEPSRVERARARRRMLRYTVQITLYLYIYTDLHIDNSLVASLDLERRANRFE